MHESGQYRKPQILFFPFKYKRQGAIEKNMGGGPEAETTDLPEPYYESKSQDYRNIGKVDASSCPVD